MEVCEQGQGSMVRRLLMGAQADDLTCLPPLQVMRHENSSILELDGKEVSEFTPSKPREKWLRKRTHVKIRVRAEPPCRETPLNVSRVFSPRCRAGKSIHVLCLGESTVSLHKYIYLCKKNTQIKVKVLI